MKSMLGVAGFLVVGMTAGWVAAQPQAAEKTPAVSAAFLGVRFEAPQEPQPVGEPVELALAVSGDRAAWPAGLQGSAQVEFLLRMPAAGVELVSEGWEPFEEEEEDPTGPWSVFTRVVPVSIPAGGPAQGLVREPIRLAVIEEGENWIITTRARVLQGDQTWQAFGVVFATRKLGQVRFHPQPEVERPPLPSGLPAGLSPAALEVPTDRAEKD